MSAPNGTAAKLAAQNDAFRQLVIASGSLPYGGMCVVTRGIAALSENVMLEIVAKVRNFSDFSKDNDPYGEHDFGAFDQNGVGKIFWKIDYYGLDYQSGSEDPTNPTLTRRVLTIMLAEEY